MIELKGQYCKDIKIFTDNVDMLGKNELKCNVINIKGEFLYEDKDNLQVHVEKHEN